MKVEKYDDWAISSRAPVWKQWRRLNDYGQPKKTIVFMAMIRQRPAREAP